jgi:hypothetical protein
MPLFDENEGIFMPALAEQPTQERQKSFDIVANVNMLRYDLQCFGEILPETRQRVLDEQLSFLAEGIDRASRTTFVLQRDEEDMRYFDRGHWRPYSAMLQTGLRVAEQEAKRDHRKEFLAEWAGQNLYQGYRMRTLQPGEQFVWFSAYAYDAEEKYGKKFMQECGLQADRKMGFIYLASAQEDGSIVLQSQTVDRSDDEAFASVLQKAEDEPRANMDEFVDAYDQVLENKFGGNFYAGRRDAEIQENAWEEIRENEDLVIYNMEELESIARQNVSEETIERMTKRHIYGVWALFKKRLEGLAVPTFDFNNFSAQPSIRAQVQVAFMEFASAGKVMAACGGSLEAEKNELTILNASVEEVYAQIFNSTMELFTSAFGSMDYYSFDVLMFCDGCQAPPTDEELEDDKRKWCGECGYCEPCDAKLRLGV